MKKRKPQSISSLAAVAVTALICSTGESSAASTRGETGESAAIEQIQRYCSKSWRTAHMPQEEWNDSTQQVLTELLERIPRERLGDAIETSESSERRELNRSIWRIAKRWVRRHRHVSIEDIDVAANDQGSAAEIDEQIEAVLRVAADELSDRQQSIIRDLRSGMSVGQIATKMQLPPSRISNEKHRAIKQIRKCLCEVA